MRTNKKYNLFTAEDIPDYYTRVAVNCHNATLVKCDDRLSNKCRSFEPELWHKCPRQTKRSYKKK